MDSLDAAITNSVLDCIVAADEAGRILEFNPAAERAFGYRRDEAVGRLIGDLLVPAAYREQHARGMKRFLRTGQSRLIGKRVEVEALHKSGRQFPVEVGLTQADLKGRQVFLAIIRDLTEQQQVNAERRRLSQILKAAVDGLPEGFGVFDTDDRLMLCNEALASFSQTTPDQLVGRHAVDIFRSALPFAKAIDGRPVDDQEEWLGRVLGRYRDPAPDPYEAELKDGRQLLARSRKAADGTTIFIVMDLTKVKAAEAEQQRLTQLLDKALEAIPAGFGMFDADDRLVLCNRALGDRFGTDPRAALGIHALDIHRRSLPKFRTINGRPVDARNQDDWFDYLKRRQASSTPAPLDIERQDGESVLVTNRKLDDGSSIFVITDITTVKQAEKERERISQLFKDAVDSVPTGFAMFDDHERLITCNEAYAALFEQKPRDLEGKSAGDLYRYGIARIRRIEGQEIGDADEALRYMMGRARQFDVEPVEVEDTNGQWFLIATHATTEGGAVSLVTDITKQKQAEATIREREKNLRAIIEGQPVPVILADYQTSEVSYYSPATADLFGLDWPPTTRPSARSHYVSEEDRLALRARLEANDGADHAQMRLRRTDGGIFWASVTSRLIDLQGRTAIIASVIDLTERMRMEAALRDSEERFRSIAEAHPVAVFIAGVEDGTIRYASPAAARLWGVPEKSLIGQDVTQFYVRQEDRVEAVESFNEKGCLDGFETMFRRADGTEFPVEMSSQPIHYQWEDCCITGVVDLTESKADQAEIASQRERLHQSEKLNALGALLAGVAHELNNPLSVLVGQSLLLKETTSDPTLAKRAERIGRAADRCSRIVKTFLSMARKSTPELAEVHLNAVIDAAVEITAYPLRTAEIKLELDTADDLPTVWGDADQLSQVLMNMVVNAQQAMADHAQPRALKLTTRADRDWVYVEVADTGPGIADDIQARLFEPFFTTKEVGQGTGIGLSISRGIVEAHEGWIEVHSQPGEGALFRIVLPRSCHRSADKDVGAPKDPQERALRILVVDDELEVAHTLHDLLSRDGHTVYTADSGREAVDLLGRQSVDVVLSDLRMPGMDGPELYHAVADRWPHLVRRLGFITGDTLSAGAAHFLDKAERPYLEKPFTPDELRDLVDKLISSDDDADDGSRQHTQGSTWTAG